MRRLHWLCAIFLLLGCVKVLSVRDIPDIALGQASFYPTIEAHTDAPIVGGNRIDILLNGDGTFPVMLREIRSAKSTITFSQYLVEDGSITHELAEAFAERCRKGVIVDILLDSHGSAKAPADIIKTMKDAGCRVEHFRRVKAEGIIFPWKLLKYNYRSHRRILVIDGRVGFTGGYGISEAWTGNGRTPKHWRDTNARIEGPAAGSAQNADRIPQTVRGAGQLFADSERRDHRQIRIETGPRQRHQPARPDQTARRQQCPGGDSKQCERRVRSASPHRPADVSPPQPSELRLGRDRRRFDAGQERTVF